MSERDEELDKLLEPLMTVRPQPMQVRRWQALARPGKAPGLNRYRIVELTAAAFIGFLIGAAFFWHRQEFQQVADNFDASATIESVYVKSN